jgi:hypothetical protein
MKRPELIDSFDIEQSLGDGSEASIVDFREAISLLQDEVARLEEELRLRDERQSEMISSGQASFPDEIEATAALENGTGRSEEAEHLKAELAIRDETTRLLLDELSRVEESHTANQAEWEHLADWLDELERRVEGQDAEKVRELENRLAAQEQKTETHLMKLERERRAWEAQRQVYQKEIDRLQGTLDQARTSPAALEDLDSRIGNDQGPGIEAVKALQLENDRLRAQWQEMVERTAAADRAESLEAKLADTLNERHQFQRQLEQIQDQARRERLEYETTVAELNTRLSQAALNQCQGPTAESTPDRVSSALEIDLRVRALRQHLLEVDQREKEERHQRRLTTRLSRLWSRTGPR